MYINILCICHILIDVGIWDMMVMLTLCITYYWRWDHTWFEAHFQSIFQKTDDNILYLIIHCEIKKMNQTANVNMYARTDDFYVSIKHIGWHIEHINWHHHHSLRFCLIQSSWSCALLNAIGVYISLYI